MSLRAFADWHLAQLKAWNDDNLGADSGVGRDVIVTRNGVDLEPQRVRLVTGSRVGSREEETDASEVFSDKVVFVGSLDFDVEQGDYVYVPEDDQRYDVQFVRTRPVRKLAEARLT